jgi:hypothetical protein
MSAAIDKSPWIETAEGRLRYRDGRFTWDVAIADIAVLGEYTNQNGPFSDDHFLAFIGRGSTEWYEASFYARGRDDALKGLASQLGTNLVCALCNSTDFRSRVMWPPALAELEMFHWTSKLFNLRVKQTIHPKLMEIMTPNKSLERPRER